MKKVISLILSLTMLLSITAGLDLSAYADESYSVGDIIEFGSYPQSEVTDEDTLSELNSLTLDWQSYGYYYGTGSTGSMTQSDYMQYADVTYNGSKYRAVTFSQYRPYCTDITSSSSYSYQYTNGYYIGNVYWFKYEPIEWRVLDPSTGLVMCETIIDSQAYSDTIYHSGSAYYNDSSYTNYANDYYTSSIREWLNDDFYNTAFSSTDKTYINTTELDNSAYSTSYSKYDSQTSYDKVFLLSYSDISNTDYGFSSSYSTYDTARRAQGSDYAKSQGLYVYTSSGSSYSGNSFWRLRTAGYDSGNATDVYYDGHVYSHFYVFNTNYGIRPALQIDLSSDIFSYDTDVKIDTGDSADTDIGYTDTSTDSSTGDSTSSDNTSNAGSADSGTSTGTGTADTASNPATSNAITSASDTSTTSTTTASTSVTKPKKTSVKKATSPKKKQIKVTWKKKSGVTGYQVQYATNKKFTKNKKTVTIKGASKTSKTIKKLKSKKTYYVRVRTYKTVNGKKTYSAWSTVEKVTTK